MKRHPIRALKADRLKCRRWSRGFLLWAATIGTQLAAAGDAAAEWTLKQWAMHLLVAAIAGTAGLITSSSGAPKASPSPSP